MTDAAYENSEFRTANRKRLLKGLFFETSPSDKSTVKYTLKDEDHLGFPSLARLYLEAEDPTEYLFANTYLESWTHWEQLCECSWFKPYIDRWRRELNVRIKSKALLSIKREAFLLDTKNSFAANKYLLEGGWEDKNSPKVRRGRPTKDEIKRAAHEIAEESANLEDDFERIMRPN